MEQEINGIYYELDLDTKTAVVCESPEKYCGDIVIPETVQYKNCTYRVESIGHSAFYCCNSLTSITIPDSVISIEDSAFEGCKSLASITIPDSVTSIGAEVFGKCDSLQTIYIPQGMTDAFCQMGLEKYRDKLVEIGA